MRWAPSAANRQPWELVLIRDETVKRELREAFLRDAADHDARYRAVTERQAELLLAPLLVAVCGDEGTKESFVNAGALGDAVQEELFVLTMGAAIQNLLLMATACGLSSTWIARAARVAGVRELLGVPARVRIVALVALGVADTPPGWSEHLRRPISSRLHAGRYGRAAT